MSAEGGTMSCKLVHNCCDAVVRTECDMSCGTPAPTCGHVNHKDFNTSTPSNV